MPPPAGCAATSCASFSVNPASTATRSRAGVAGDLRHLAQRDADFASRAWSSRSARLARRSRPGVLAGAEHDKEAEASAIGPVAVVEAGDLGRRQRVQPGCRLLARRRSPKARRPAPPVRPGPGVRAVAPPAARPARPASPRTAPGRVRPGSRMGAPTRRPRRSTAAPRRASRAARRRRRDSRPLTSASVSCAMIAARFSRSVTVLHDPDHMMDRSSKQSWAGSTLTPRTLSGGGLSDQSDRATAIRSVMAVWEILGRGVAQPVGEVGELARVGRGDGQVFGVTAHDPQRVDQASQKAVALAQLLGALSGGYARSRPIGQSPSACSSPARTDRRGRRRSARPGHNTRCRPGRRRCTWR